MLGRSKRSWYVIIFDMLYVWSWGLLIMLIKSIIVEWARVISIPVWQSWLRHHCDGIRPLLMDCWPPALPSRHRSHTAQGQQEQTPRQHHDLSQGIHQKGRTGIIQRSCPHLSALLCTHCPLCLYLREDAQLHQQNSWQVYEPQVSKTYLPLLHISLRWGTCSYHRTPIRHSPHPHPDEPPRVPVWYCDGGLEINLRAWGHAKILQIDEGLHGDEGGLHGLPLPVLRDV